MNVIITGAGFGNKGAQTMLFITVYEIKKRYSEYNVFFVSGERVDTESIKAYSFDIIYRAAFFDALRSLTGLPGLKRSFSDKVRNVIKIFVKYRMQKGAFSGYVRKIISDTVIFIDLSGFALSSAFKPRINKEYLTCIDSARLLGIPVVLMPQSFGPFDYDESIKDKMMENIRRIMKYPELIFAREQDGYDQLVNEIGSDKVVLSPDLVLQNKEFDIGKITDVSRLKTDVPEVNTDKNVAIIPNKRVLDKFKDDEAFYSLYDGILRLLLDRGRNVYLIYHSNEDLLICRKIKDTCGSERVYVVDEEMNFWQFAEYISNFDYVIASRYHSIIHSFKQGVPCIGLGWAVKYKELFEQCEQGNYVFDLTASVDLKAIYDAILQLDTEWKKESDTIRRNIDLIQKDNCFDKLFELMQGEKLKLE